MTQNIYTPSELEDMPTLCVGQCCSLKIDDGMRRVWLCRVAGGVTIEKRNAAGQWRPAGGGCAHTNTTVEIGPRISLARRKQR